MTIAQWFTLLFSLVLPLSGLAQNPVVEIRTTLGVIVVELDPEHAPITVKNFLDYVESDGYEAAIFHRVIPEFMIQTGGYYESLADLDEKEAIRNEADNGLKNVVGTIAMARMDEIDSATRQFFINTADNTGLDHSTFSCTRADEERAAKALERGLYRPQSCRSFGYTVFGKVIEGMEVVWQIEGVATEVRGYHDDIPVETITVERVVLRPAP